MIAVLRIAASLKLTLVCLAAAAAIAIAGDGADWPVGLVIAAPFAVLCLNLLAAILVHPKLRRQGGLLGFHLALAALALVVAVDRLMALTGHVEITEGGAFDPTQAVIEAGPLHRPRLDKVRFIQDGFDIAYAPGMRRRETVSTIHVAASDGGWQTEQVGDHTPLTVGGYRFYTSFNKGFAPVLTYTDKRGRSYRGSVHLPSYPLNYYQQGNDWVPPGRGEALKIWLNLPEPVYREDKAWRFAKPANASLVLFADGRRWELAPGQSVTLSDGRVRYDELRTWMGYTISYNPLGAWMLAAVLIGVLCLGWHAVARKFATPWDIDMAVDGGADVR